ncbi:MAG: hypothetical protein J3K34DRAFT_445199 [Monoraphidium minutum]|nr:MAG: hypothetical protein J3K34DRAFT_445199 [Monoraphidium minutum]
MLDAQSAWHTLNAPWRSSRVCEPDGLSPARARTNFLSTRTYPHLPQLALAPARHAHLALLRAYRTHGQVCRRAGWPLFQPLAHTSRFDPSNSPMNLTPRRRAYGSSSRVGRTELYVPWGVANWCRAASAQQGLNRPASHPHAPLPEPHCSGVRPSPLALCVTLVFDTGIARAPPDQHALLATPAGRIRSAPQSTLIRPLCAPLVCM